MIHKGQRVRLICGIWNKNIEEHIMKMNISKIAFISALFLMLPVQFSYGDETAYGSQLMTEQERIEHRNKMQSLKTKVERERYRIEHHKLMQERAKQQGVTLPDKPQQRGKGMGMDNGLAADKAVAGVAKHIIRFWPIAEI